MCKILRAVEGMLLGYNDLQAALRGYGYLGQDRQRNRGFFSGIVRGVSDPREGSKILTFLFRSRPVCILLLHLKRSWKVDSANFAFVVFSGVRRTPAICPPNSKDRSFARYA